MTCEKDAGNRRKAQLIASMGTELKPRLCIESWKLEGMWQDPFSDEFEIFHFEHQVCAKRRPV